MNKMEIKSNLNSRQWALYRYLKKKGDEWTTQYQIVQDLSDVYCYTEDDYVTFHDSPVRHTLTKDIRAINDSDYIHKPLLSGVKGVKLANKQEIDKYIGSNMMSAVRKIKRLRKLADKADKNGQYRLKLSQYQKEIYESLLDNNVS